MLTLQGIGFTGIKQASVEEVLKECEICMDVRNHKKPRKQTPGITIAKEKTCGCSVFMDHKTIITKARQHRILDNSDPDYVPDGSKQSILTIFEPLSSLVAAYPVSDYSSAEVKRALRIWMMNNGPPKNVIADNAPNFTALKTWLKDGFNSELHHTSVYHPNSNLSERAHREFERVLKIYDVKCGKYKFEEWEDHLALSIVATNSLRSPKFKISPFEAHKNRIQSNVEPLEFHPAPMEQKLATEKFLEKADRSMSSTLKVAVPVFKRGQIVKVSFPDQLPRMGKVTATKDFDTRGSVQVKFDQEKSVSVSKDYICLPKNGILAPEQSQPGEEILERNIPAEEDQVQDNFQAQEPS